MANQDMPPPGGFSSIKVERTFATPLLRQGIWGAILVALTFNGLSLGREWKRRHRVLKLEQSEHYIATMPFMIAEQERKFLNYLYDLREEERELMKDHKNWKLGTFYGEPVYKTLPKGVLPYVSPNQYANNRPDSEWLLKVINPDGY